MEIKKEKPHNSLLRKTNVKSKSTQEKKKQEEIKKKKPPPFTSSRLSFTSGEKERQEKRMRVREQRGSVVLNQRCKKTQQERTNPADYGDRQELKPSPDSTVCSATTDGLL